MKIQLVLGVILWITLLITFGATNLIQHDAEAVRPRVSIDNGTTFGPMLC
jgi:hypothetical protein